MSKTVTSTAPTLEAVLAMPAGPALDALVVERVFAGRVVHDTLTGRVACARLSPTGDYDELLPFSTDIAAAWRVIEHLSSGGKMVAWTRRDMASWEAGFGETLATAETLPLAVCRAALLWSLSRCAGPGTG